MKRCPTCQRTYSDDTLRYCLEDGTALLSASAPTSGETLVLPDSGSGVEPPPTEIFYGPAPTLLAQDQDATLPRKPAPTIRQQARPTIEELPHAPASEAPTKQRSTSSVVAITVVATVLLLGLGGLGAWLMLRDKNGSGSNSNLPSSNNSSGSNTSNTDRPPATPTPSATPTQTATPYTTPSATPTPTATPTDPSYARKEVMQALNGWTETMGKLDAHMAYYASTLHTYYLQTNVSASRVRGYIAPAFSKYSSFDVKLSNVQIEIDSSGQKAVADFDKTFTFSGDSVYSGSGRSRFWLEKFGGRWLVTGEKDLKVYYINK